MTVHYRFLGSDAGEQITFLSNQTHPNTDAYDGDQEMELVRDGETWQAYTGSYQNGRFVRESDISFVVSPDVLDVFESIKNNITKVYIDTDATEWKAEAYLDPSLSESVRYPEVSLLDQTAERLQAHWASLDLGVAALSPDQEVVKIFERFKKFPEETNFVFQGQTYLVGQDDVNAIVNDALEASGSEIRAYFGYFEGRVGGYYGKVTMEYKQQIGDQTMRILYFGDDAVQLGMRGMLGSNDSLSAVALSRDQVRQALKDRLKIDHKNYDQPSYRRDEYLVVMEALQQPGFDMERAIDNLAELVLQHEFAHLAFMERYGLETKFMRYAMSSVGCDSYLAFEEVFCDLAAIDSIVKTVETDPQKAKRQYDLWLCSRGPNFEGTSLGGAQECTLNVLLSSLQSDGSVNFSLLEAYNTSLKQTLHDIFEEVGFHIRIDTLPLEQGEAPEAHKKRFRQSLDDLAKTEYGNLHPGTGISFEGLRRMLCRNAINRALSAQNPMGGTQAQSFFIEGEGYEYSVDQWMRDNLRLQDAPFDARQITTIQTGPQR